MLEIMKDLVIFIVVPLLILPYKFLWDRVTALETVLKHDLSSMLDQKFQGFELRLINEGKINPSNICHDEKGHHSRKGKKNES